MDVDIYSVFCAGKEFTITRKHPALQGMGIVLTLVELASEPMGEFISSLTQNQELVNKLLKLIEEKGVEGVLDIDINDSSVTDILKDIDFGKPVSAIGRILSKMDDKRKNQFIADSLRYCKYGDKSLASPQGFNDAFTGDYLAMFLLLWKVFQYNGFFLLFGTLVEE